MSVSPEPSSERSLPPDTNFNSTSLDQRKRDVRDILSSFDVNDLPSEYCSDICIRITNEQSTRPNSEWTVFGDLRATMLTWGVHDSDGWTFINKWIPKKIRAQLFCEKLQRRFQREFDGYDKIANSINEPEAQSQSPAHVSSRIAQAAGKINSLVAEALLDLDFRSVGQKHTARVLLEAIEEICMRSRNISPALLEGDPLTSGMELEISLYDALIRRPPATTPMVILEALTRVSDISPGLLQALKIRFEAPDIPSTYGQRFHELCTQAGVVL
ncbi:uncharacterized protein Z519_09467 [Cladophialophora bantiana CBS 173.52]|uniref:Uncharacterized protein n=1 Tax=Cladophialophora bantiana (strain ATCC 10958 / CBS 173.52 / CDC B-1940 / NIH 8579) TaxID=1442370 RepID=A0A0D2FU30_CLAB1|nr:uncharacterized protein Z519_09467 [Cladophialophora bantiana CBS 173.52]KIW90037.1 hypothetical protein Z519_09467 [Cladophialophora bantiana CBS 173.52]